MYVRGSGMFTPATQLASRFVWFRYWELLMISQVWPSCFNQIMFNLHDGFSIKKPSILGIPHLWKPPLSDFLAIFGATIFFAE